MRRIICAVLILTCLLSVSPIGVYAVESSNLTSQSIVVVVDKDGKSFEYTLPVVVKDDELYVEPQSLTEITRYQILTEETRIVYSLGLKSIWIDLVQQTLQVNLTNQPFSGTLQVNDTHYLPLSELLPWMNVQCYEIDKTMYLDSDPLSYWEVTKDFSINSRDYLFDLSEQYGQTTTDVVGLCAISVFDCILDLENLWKKIVPIEDSSTSLYDYEIYKECFREFALPDVGTEAEIQALLSGLSNIVSDSSQFLNSYYEAIYTQNTYDKIAEQFGEDIATEFDKIPSDAKQLTDTLKLAKTALKHLKTSYLYTRIALSDTTDYAQALRHIYMRDGITPPAGIELAASEATIALESQSGAIADAAATICAEVGIKALEDTVKETTEGVIETVAGKTIFSSLGLYLDIIDATLSLVWPVNDAYSDISKMTVYQSIQYDALNAYYEIPGLGNEVSNQDISNGRTCALIYLKTAKKCYKAQQKTFDLFGGKGVLDYQIQDINKEILQFELSALAEERDAICDRRDEVSELKKFWKTVISADQHQYDTSYQGEWVNGYILGGIWDQTLRINSIEGNLINFDVEFYRTMGYENQTATIHSDGSITFTAADEYTSITGSLELGDSITMHISESTCENIEPKTIVFERRDPQTDTMLAATSGIWYQFSPESTACEEYTFFADGTYIRKVWDFYSEYIDPMGYIYDYSKGFYNEDLTINGQYTIAGQDICLEGVENTVIRYNQSLDRFEWSVIDPNTNVLLNGYMVHYSTAPDLIQLRMDEIEYTAYWRFENEGYDASSMSARTLVTSIVDVCHLFLPCIVLPGDEVNALNLEMYKTFNALSESEAVTAIGYSAETNGNILSLVVQENTIWNEERAYYVYSIDLTNYSIMSSREVAAQFGITTNYDDIVRQVMRGFAQANGNTEADESQRQAMEKVLSQENVNNAIFYVGEENRLMLSCCVPFLLDGNMKHYNYCIPISDYV